LLPQNFGLATPLFHTFHRKRVDTSNTLLRAANSLVMIAPKKFCLEHLLNICNSLHSGKLLPADCYKTRKPQNLYLLRWSLLFGIFLQRIKNVRKGFLGKEHVCPENFATVPICDVGYDQGFRGKW